MSGADYKLTIQCEDCTPNGVTLVLCAKHSGAKDGGSVAFESGSDTYQPPAGPYVFKTGLNYGTDVADVRRGAIVYQRGAMGADGVLRAETYASVSPEGTVWVKPGILAEDILRAVHGLPARVVPT